MPFYSTENLVKKAYTETTASLVVPTVNSNVTISVVDSDVVGGYLFVENAGFYLVISKPSGTQIQIQNLGTTGNASAGSTIASGSKVFNAGKPGVNGANGADGATGATGATGSVEAASTLKLIEQTSAPAAETGKVLIYAKTDKKLYKKPDTGTESELGAGTGGGRELLTANKTYYVDLVSGSDSNNGLSNGAPFLTLQKALDTAAQLDINIYDCIIQIADQTSDSAVAHTSPIIVKMPVTSGGRLILRGNVANPDNVKINCSYNSYFLRINNQPGIVLLEGFTLQCTSGFSGDKMHLLWCANSYVQIKDLVFGANGTATLDNQAQISSWLGGTVEIVGNYKITGGGYYAHIWCRSGGKYIHNSSNVYAVTLQNNPNYSTFVLCELQSLYTPFYTLLTYTGSATGKRYEVDTLSIIRFTGNNPNYFPGNQAGVITNGAIYL